MTSVKYATLENWSLQEHVQTFCFDTTESSTERIKDACILLEQNIRKNNILFGCHHHILKIDVVVVFVASKFVITGPDILFKKFKNK